MPDKLTTIDFWTDGACPGNGKSPNGTWNLWVVDDTQQGAGDFNGGWCVDILTSGGKIER